MLFLIGNRSWMWKEAEYNSMMPFRSELEAEMVPDTETHQTRLKSDNVEDVQVAMSQGKTGIKKIDSAFISAEGSMHLNAPKMNSSAGEQGCLKDK